VQEDLESGSFVDRYKASGFKAYNFKLPRRYDDSIVAKVFRVSVMDDFVLDELGVDIGGLAILDVGCATGRLLDRLAANGARRLAGSDLAPQILDVARSKLALRGADVKLECADAETSLPWPSHSFSVVTLTGVLHHFFIPHAALSEISRVLRPGGRLIIVDPCFFFPVREFFNLCLKVHPHEGDYHFYTPLRARKMLVDMGWQVDRCERLNWCFYGIVAVRGQTTLPNSPLLRTAPGSGEGE
jgi:SAM-dependent methyltransferase